MRIFIHHKRSYISAGDGICDCGDVVGEFEVAYVTVIVEKRRLRCGGLCEWD